MLQRLDGLALYPEEFTRRFTMFSRLHILAGVIAILMIMMLGCSSEHSQSSDPVTPQLSSQTEIQEAGHYLWAYYQGYVNPEEDIFELTPVRQAADHWNVLKFLESGPCTNCVKITDIDPGPDDTTNVEVTITHPFPTANLTGFDVRGVVIFSGSHTFASSGLTTSNRDLGDGELMNPDGFTTLYNPTTFGSGPGGFQGYFKGKFSSAITPNALLNGYRQHVSPGPSNTRNAFFASGAVPVTYQLAFPDGSFVFGYAVDASWTNPSVNPVNDPITDFPPDANCQEPWKIDYIVEGVGQGLNDQGGEAKITLDVYDYQGKNSTFPPVVECQDLFAGTANAVFVEDFTDYTRYEVTIENEAIAETGTYKCLVKVEDTANITAPDYLDLTAYQVIPLVVSDWIQPENQPPTAAAMADNYNPAINETVNFTDQSTDPDGAADIIKWEWDLSYNGSSFVVDSELQNPSDQYTIPGTYHVQLRVTDSMSHSDMLDTPLEIIVTDSGNSPPIACGDADNTHPNVNTLIHFYDCSIDEDGLSDIVFFEWDLNADGFYEKSIKDVTKIYTEGEGGDYEVQHRVTDTADNQDILDEPLLIEVNDFPEAIVDVDATDVQMGELVTLTNASTDYDGNGDIEHIYWDIDGDDEWDDDYDDEEVVQLIFYEGGVHEINMMVVDEWGLEDEIDDPIIITVQGFDPFCVDLIDQYNSADSLYGTRVFNYYQGYIGDIPNLDYDDSNGPWNFLYVPASQPAICEWFTSSNIDESAVVSAFPGADFYFKEAAPVAGGSIYAPHTFEFTDPPDNGYLQLDGQWQAGSVFTYGDAFQIDHPICHPWSDAGSGSGVVVGVNFDISWSMTSLGTGAAWFNIDGTDTPVNCMLIRHNISFVDTDFGYMSFSLLNYQWIDEDGNEVAFMQATNGLDGTNFSGNTYTGDVICRSQKSIQ